MYNNSRLSKYTLEIELGNPDKGKVAEEELRKGIFLYFVL